MSSVEVTFLGSGDAFGSGGRLQTCIAIESGSSKLLFDCGASALTAMKKHGVAPESIRHILVSHLHGDHFGGLPFFVLDAQFSRRSAPLAMIGPPGLEGRVRQAMEVFFPGSSETQWRFPVQFREIAPGQRTDVEGGIFVTPFEVQHFCGSPPYALRLEIAGRTIVYSGDTEWTDNLLDAARGADLFICEAYYFDKKIRYHLDYRTLESHRAGLRCDRLVLTHMHDDMLERLDSLDVEAAFDGKVIRL